MSFSFSKGISILLYIAHFTMLSQADFEIQGHRGARGLMPANTIPSFRVALDFFVDTIELDVVISKDKQVVVSHDPFISSEICLTPNGKEITPEEEENLKIYQMTYDEISKFDCGSKGEIDFPEQAKIKESKPLLKQVIQAMEAYRCKHGLQNFRYTIELKSTVEGDNINHPEPKEFSDLVYEVINCLIPLDRVAIISFDFRVLKYWHKKHPEVKLAAVTSDPVTSEEVIEQLGFTPTYFTPYLELLTSEADVKSYQSKGMLVVPYTVDNISDMIRLEDWGVDGFVTNYPNRALFLQD